MIRRYIDLMGTRPDAPTARETAAVGLTLLGGLLLLALASGGAQ